MVVLGLARSLLGSRLALGDVLAALALLAWYAAGITGRRSPAWVTYLWLAGLSLLCVTAVWISADFAWVSFAVFVTYANVLGPTRAIAAIAALAGGTGGVLVGRWPSDDHWAAQIVGPVIGAAVAATLVGISRLASAETAERQRLLDELLTTRDDLARAHLDAGTRTERERLTREIHDTLAQGFTSVVLAARRGRHASGNSDHDTARAEIDHIEALGHTGVEHARRLVHHLSPAELENRPLPAALELLGRRGLSAADPTIEVRIDGEAHRLLPEVEVALLRVAQEAVTNARRHARADRVVVTLTFQPATVRLDVADDGIGFDPARRPARGFGLSSMRSRVEQLGGTFIIESAAGEGAALNATVPTGRRPAKVAV